MRTWRSKPHTLAGAYALGAVTRADRARFERHLARCEDCGDELRWLREAAARLAGAVAAEPPPDLVQRAVASASQTPQLRPTVGGATRWRSRRAGSQDRTSRARAPASGHRAIIPGFTMVSVIALMAAAAISLVLAIRADRQLNQAGSREQLIARVLTAPDAVMLTAPVMSDGTATVVMSHRDRSLVFTTAGLPPLPNGQCYQLWLMGPRGDRSAGMLPAQHAGMTSPVIASGLAARDWVGLTVEPEGGSSRPTSRPVLMMSLAA